MAVVARSYWPLSLYCEKDKTDNCGRTLPHRNIQNNSYITIIKEKRTDWNRKRVPLNQNECTADFRIGVPFEQNLHSERLQSQWPEPFFWNDISFLRKLPLWKIQNYFIWKLDCQTLRAYHVREFVEMCHFVNIFEGFRFNKYFKFKKNKIIITAQEDSGNPVTKERSWLMTN